MIDLRRAVAEAITSTHEATKEPYADNLSEDAVRRMADEVLKAVVGRISKRTADPYIRPGDRIVPMPLGYAVIDPAGRAVTRILVGDDGAVSVISFLGRSPSPTVVTPVDGDAPTP